MSEKIVKAALGFYGLEPRRIFAEAKGYRNRNYRVLTTSDEDLNLVFYKKEEGILARVRRADFWAEAAAEAGLSTRIVYDPRILSLGDGRIARLYRWLPGETIPWEGWTMKSLKLLGQAMSDLHFAWSETNGAQVKSPRTGAGKVRAQVKMPRVYDENMDILERERVYFADENAFLVLRRKTGIIINPAVFKYLERGLAAAEKEPDGICHMDLTRGNVLFGAASDGDAWRMGDLALAGIIDFEKVSAGTPLFDIARTLAFLFADVAGKSQSDIYKYLIVSGYNKRGRGSINLDKKLLDCLIGFYLFYDFYKFLRHNPYESLSENYHFGRTRDILLARKMIKLV
jgi:Ser/Thr protein kinase RdoA (MazF antagonist)